MTVADRIKDVKPEMMTILHTLLQKLMPRLLRGLLASFPNYTGMHDTAPTSK
jgi:hypothetical protein